MTRLLERFYLAEGMAASESGPWQPLRLTATVEMFSDAPFRWWMSGGHALELHVGRSWRDHDDIDVGVMRRDVPALRSILDRWDVRVAAAGRLLAWSGEALEIGLHQNNLWCRRTSDGPWQLDVTIGEGDDEGWMYRRDPRIRFPWSEAVVRTANGIPYLAPDLQLLFKAKNPRAKDDLDAQVVIPELDQMRRDRLRWMLPSSHPWHSHLEG